MFAKKSEKPGVPSSCTSCSQTRRNGPGISANANYTFCVCTDQTCTAKLYGGSCFAAPMWAGFLALVSQPAVANGKPPLGFVNPALYTILGGSSYATDFHAITGGSNGFQATVGYDLVTGIGSPNGQALVNSLAGTSTGSFTVTDDPKTVTVTRGAAGLSKITSTISGGFQRSNLVDSLGTGHRREGDLQSEHHLRPRVLDARPCKSR